MKEGEIPLESRETVRLSLGGSLLDPFQTLCCIRNEAEKSIKIFKIVVSCLPARLEDLYLKWRKTALFRTYQQLRDSRLHRNARPSIRFFSKTPELLFRRIKRGRFLLSVLPSIKHDQPGSFPGRLSPILPRPPAATETPPCGPVPALRTRSWESVLASGIGEKFFSKIRDLSFPALDTRMTIRSGSPRSSRSRSSTRTTRNDGSGVSSCASFLYDNLFLRNAFERFRA